MKPAHFRITLATAAALSCLPMVASAFDYNYVEGGYLHRDNDFADEGGFRIGGSFAIDPQVNLFGEYGSTNAYDQITAGAQFHTPINNELDFTAGGSLEHLSGGGHTSTGFGMRAGVRWNVVPGQWELNPEVRYTHLDGDNLTSARVGASYHINRQFDIQAALQGGDEDRVEAGVRYNF